MAFPPGTSASHALALIPPYVFSCQLTSPTVVLRYTAANLAAKPDFVTLAGHGQCAQMLAVNGKLYVFAPADHLRIAEIDPATLAWTDVVNDAAEGSSNGSIASDGTNLYVGYASTRIVKYRMSDWTKVAATNLTKPFGLYNVHALGWDGTNLWAAGSLNEFDTFSAWVARIAPDLTYTEQIMAGTQSVTDDMDFSGDYAMVGFESRGRVARINKATLAFDVIDTGTAKACYGLTARSPGVWAYWVGPTPGVVTLIDPATEAIQRYVFDQPGEVSPNELVFDGATGYAAFMGTPGLARFDVPSGPSVPTPVPTLTPTVMPAAAHIMLNCPNGVAVGATCTVVAP